MAWRGGMTWEEEHRNTLRATQTTLGRASESIARSTQVAVETEEIGTGVISELGQQRETLLRARQRIIETDAELGRSRAVLRKMACGVFSNKIILVLIIILEVAILGALAYLKFFKK